MGHPHNINLKNTQLFFFHSAKRRENNCPIMIIKSLCCVTFLQWGLNFIPNGPRPTILEPIEGQQQQVQQLKQQQHHNHQHQQALGNQDGLDKKSILESNIDEESSTFEFPIMRNRLKI